MSSVFSLFRLSSRPSTLCPLLKRHVSVSTVSMKDNKSNVVKYTDKKDIEKEILDPDDRRYLELLKTGKITIDEPQDVGLISAIPEEHIKTRRARIYRPSKNAMQSGTYNTKKWKLEFEARERWENPLMGWTSTGDPMSNLNVWFASAEEAAEFCEKNGWQYEVEETTLRKELKKLYADNFSWDKRTRVGTK